ncbi:MAG TPA: hypothetical protein PLS49_00175 [Candidatus Woesebacteria bacterium]|nr:hypothetical protein [Candidatus Woesebacteria bacterium]
MKYKLLLFGIILLAAVLRLWNLGNVPISPDWDEAALGYNAYSLLQTGKDEYGATLPMTLQSFGDYKPALYAYLIIPFIPVFGLSDIAVRLPSAIFGIIAVGATYLLVKELLYYKKNKKENTHVSEKLRQVLPLLSAGLLAISPWHIQFSRVAFESNVGLTCNILLVLCFIVGLRKNWIFIFSGFFAALSIYTYQSEKIFTPLLVLVLTVIYRKELFKVAKKYLVLAFVIGALVSLPMVYFTATNEHGLARAKGTSVFSSQDDILKYSIQKIERDKKDNNVLGLILDNRRVEYTKLIFSGYLAHYDLKWLFVTGDAQRHHAPFMGLLYLWELPFLLIGIYTAAFSPLAKQYRKSQFVLFSWFLIAPIPAAITNDVPHAVRTLNFLPTFQIFTAIGLLTFYVFVQKIVRLTVWKKISVLALTGLVVVVSGLNIAYYLNQYFVQQNYFYSEYWQYGYKEAVSYAANNYEKYERIIVSSEVPLDQSYIFFLYYLQFPPHEYQTTQGENHSFGKFEFRPIEWKTDSTLSNTLFIGAPGEFPEVVPADHTIQYLNGEEAIKIVSTD